MWSYDQILFTLAFFMGEVIITQILYGFNQKKKIFNGWSWFSNMRLLLGKTWIFTALWQKGKTKSQKVLRETSKGPLCTPHSSLPE